MQADAAAVHGYLQLLKDLNSITDVAVLRSSISFSSVQIIWCLLSCHGADPSLQVAFCCIHCVVLSMLDRLAHVLPPHLQVPATLHLYPIHLYLTCTAEAEWHTSIKAQHAY